MNQTKLLDDWTVELAHELNKELRHKCVSSIKSWAWHSKKAHKLGWELAYDALEKRTGVDLETEQITLKEKSKLNVVEQLGLLSELHKIVTCLGLSL